MELTWTRPSCLVACEYMWSQLKVTGDSLPSLGYLISLRHNSVPNHNSSQGEYPDIIRAAKVSTSMKALYLVQNPRHTCQKYKNKYSATGHESTFFSKEVSHLV